MGILQSHTVGAVSDKDIVVLTLGTHEIRLYYQTTFEVVNGLRLAAKIALRHEGLQMPDWRAVLDTVKPQLPARIKTYKGYRRSDMLTNVDTWKVQWNGSLVVVKFNELTAELHYSDALRLHLLLRAAAKNAKAWSGDDAKQMRVSAYLNDAEDNYKYNYAI